MAVPIIAPSILSSNFAYLQRDCDLVLQNGADWLHVDIMDGHFVNNITIGPCVVESLRKSLPNAFLDCHMMVEEPEKWILNFIDAGANQVTFHIEALQDVNSQTAIEKARSICALIRSRNVRASISLKPGTPVSAIEPLLKEGLLDCVLVMTVEPGFGGQSFLPEVLPKCRELRERYPSLDIQVDGGINSQTIKEAAASGANIFVAGSAIFNHKGGPAEAIAALKECTRI